MQHQNITFRVPSDLIARLDAAVKAEAESTGLRVDRSSLLRKLMHQSLAPKEKSERKVGVKS